MIGIKFTILTSIKSRTFLLAVFAAVIAVAGITFGASVAEATAGSPLYSWGHIANGRLGRPATTESPNNRPARVLDESNIAQDNWVTSSTAAGGSWAINARGELFAWGAPWDAYQMGQGGVQPPAAVLTPENNSIARPMRVGTADNWVQVASVQSFVVLLSSDGEVYRLGNGVTAGNPANIFGGANASNIPVRVYGGPSNFVHITGGSGQIYALTEDGEMWVAGDNNQGQLANGAIGGSSMTLVKVENTDDDWVFADGRGSSALAINANGELFSWGSNSNGQTGQGVTLGITTIPTQIETASNWVDARKILNAGAALNSDGEIFMWGDNGFGRTGQGTAVGNTLQLSQVGNADNWVSLSGGNESMLALNEAGELWGWGANSLGQLGLGHNTSPQTTPQFVLRVRDAHVNASRGGGSHSIFVLRAEPRNLPMTKQLIMPKGTPLPTPTPSSVSFDFNFTPVRVRVSDSPVTYSRNVTDFAGIIDSPQTVSVSLSAPASSDDVAVPPTHTFAGELDLWEFFEYHLSEFPAGGVFVFNVSEASGSTTPSLPGIMTYCTNRFQVRVWICRDGDLLDIHAFPITGGTSPNYTVGAKSDIVFSNRYRVDVNLDITKQVTGQFADLNTPFTFDLTLTSGSFVNIPTSITAYVYAYNDATPPVFGRTARTVTITNGSALGFALYHTERLLIPNLPAGTTFSVREHATPGFAPSARVYLGAATPPPAPTAAWSGSANAGYELSTGNHVLTAGAGRNAADFTNNFELPPPETGLFISNNIPLLIVAVLATTLTAYITLRNRKKIEELPL